MMNDITYGTFIFFGTSVVVGVAVVYFLMPETKGLSLEEMDVLFRVKGMAINKRRKAEEIIKGQREAEQMITAEKEASSHVEKV